MWRSPAAVLLFFLSLSLTEGSELPQWRSEICWLLCKKYYEFLLQMFLLYILSYFICPCSHFLPTTVKFSGLVTGDFGMHKAAITMLWHLSMFTTAVIKCHLMLLSWQLDIIKLKAAENLAWNSKNTYVASALLRCFTLSSDSTRLCGQKQSFYLAGHAGVCFWSTLVRLWCFNTSKVACCGLRQW